MQHSEEFGHDYESVLGGDKITYTIETVFGEEVSTETPHYC